MAVKLEDLNTISDLKPWPDNPRSMSSLSQKGLSVSMDEFGDISGIVYNVRTDRLVCGHRRTESLPADLALGAVTPYKDDKGTVAYSVTKQGGVAWTVRFVDWDEERELAANITANNMEIQGFFTPDIGPMLDDLRQSNPSLFADTLMGSITAMQQQIEDIGPTGGDPVAKSIPSDEVIPSHVRVFYLFLNDETLGQFEESVSELQALYGLENPTDTVFKAIKDAAYNTGN